MVENNLTYNLFKETVEGSVINDPFFKEMHFRKKCNTVYNRHLLFPSVYYLYK
jgi:hypothetical protein